MKNLAPLNLPLCRRSAGHVLSGRCQVQFDPFPPVTYALTAATGQPAADWLVNPSDITPV